MSYSPQVIDRLLEWVTEGKTVAEFCRMPGMPNRHTINQWVKTNDSFKRRYHEARDLGFDAIAERVRATARGKTGTEGDSTGDWQRDRMICDMDLKLLAKWSPNRYGERVELAHTLGSEDARAIGDRLENLLESAFAMLDSPPEVEEDRW